MLKSRNKLLQIGDFSEYSSLFHQDVAEIFLTVTLNTYNSLNELCLCETKRIQQQQMFHFPISGTLTSRIITYGNKFIYNDYNNLCMIWDIYEKHRQMTWISTSKLGIKVPENIYFVYLKQILWIFILFSERN